MRRTLITAFGLAATINLASGHATSVQAASDVVDVRGVARGGETLKRNVVVWVDAPGSAPPGPKPVLDQRNIDFYPRVLAVQGGSVVEFPNHDRVLHNVFSLHNGKRFDLGMYPTGTVRHVTFDRPGLSRVLCNIHPHMAAYIMAVASPFFAVSGEDGRFTIRGVPRGTYTYHTWCPGGSETTGSATIGPDTVLEVQCR